jgi:hypothetical protein
MNKSPKLIYLLRKSIQADPAAIPVLKRDDFPLCFYFKGQEINIAVTQKGNIEVTKQRLTGAGGK